MPDGPVRAHVAVDLVDMLAAADDLKLHLKALLKHDPSTKRGARASAKHATYIEVISSSELLYHVRRLTRNWEKRVVDALYRRAERASSRKAAA